ncbi:YlbF family regulator [Staphylococcus sp. SQ8-PEA]|uniref:YlbF family regulator n=1 Tax=Staphylococcus marylandisciuri TaxID=2981529 RepID=A0ABT2QS13_9STAP|nr:YlbF family regulator [Staphylococcus marylandisciuri]MCU5746774.1 YlbF family regulator [Staphylococcus marylandisciuri]
MYEKDEILKEASKISDNIKNLDIVKDYQRVEQQIHENKSIDSRMKTLKQNQKQAVNLQNYGKFEALKHTENTINDLKDDINQLPIVDEFRTSQREANSLLQLMIKVMENRLNERHQDSKD